MNTEHKTKTYDVSDQSLGEDDTVKVIFQHHICHQGLLSQYDFTGLNGLQPICLESITHRCTVQLH